MEGKGYNKKEGRGRKCETKEQKDEGTEKMGWLRGK